MLQQIHWYMEVRAIVIYAWGSLICSCMIFVFSFSSAEASEWTLDRNLVERIEAHITLPPTAGSLSNFNRYYAKKKSSSKKLLIGLYLNKTFNPHSGEDINIVDESKLPHVLDGGCGVIYMQYDIDNDRLIDIKCNGNA
jgi:hypothetical protein